MKEELINFETAKLAKEKGFDIECKLFYITEDRPAMGYNISAKESLSDNTQYNKYILAPTQSLLQKWLREVHNIYVESYHDLTSDGEGVQYYTNWGFIQGKDINRNQNVNGGYDEYNDCKSYEEALNFGLQEGLKLIKIAQKEKYV